MRRAGHPILRALLATMALVMLSTGLTSPAVAATTTTVSGTVSFGTPGSHPAGLTARVWLDTNDGFNWSSRVASTDTDAAGAYSLTVPTNVFVRLHFEPLQTGWQSQYYLDHQAMNSATSIATGTAPTTGIDQTLPATATISGRVFLGSTATAAGAGQVRASWSVCREWDGCISQTPPSVLTDANGDYAFTGLTNGTYTVRFALVSGSTYQPPAPLTFVVSAARTQWTGQDVTLPRANSISGQVSLGSTSTPAGAGAVTVTYYGYINSAYWPLGTATTDAAGRYELLGVANGNYRLWFDSASDAFADEWWNSVYSERQSTYVTVNGSSATGTDAVLSAAATLSGTLTDSAGAAIRGLTVTARAYYGYYQGGDAYGATFETTSDVNGNYVFTGMPAGQYSVGFLRTNCFAGDPGCAEYINPLPSATLVEGQTTDLDARLFKPGYIDGYVSCAGCVDGASTVGPRAQMSAVLERRASASDPWVYSTVVGVGDWNGYYQFRSVEPGEYRVRITYSGTGGYSPSTSGAAFTLIEGRLVSRPAIDVRLYATAIAAVYASSGGASGPLGAATSAAVPFSSAGGGTLQHFTGGSIYSSASGGTHIVWADPIRTAYWAANSIFGTYGWPSGDRFCGAGVCTQSFLGGAITATTLLSTQPPAITGNPIVGATLTASPGTYSPTATSFSYRWLRGSTQVATGASYTPVAADQGSTLRVEVTANRAGNFPAVTLSAPTAAIGPSAAMQIAALYSANSVALGAATSAAVPFANAGGGALQHFAGGSIYSSTRGGTHIVWADAVRAAYWAANSIFGTYGWPSGDRTCTGDTCTQQFTGGTITASPTPAMRIAALYASNRVALGSATSDAVAFTNAGGGTLQHFTGGSIYSSVSGGTHIVWADAVRATYWAANSIFGTYGWPSGDRTCTGGTCTQQFTGGTITATPTPAMQIASLYSANSAALGAATSAAVAFTAAGGGTLQHFTRGSIYSSVAGGTRIVWADPLRATYWAANSIFGTYGWPKGDRSCTAGTCTQQFTGGTITAVVPGTWVQRPERPLKREGRRLLGGTGAATAVPDWGESLGTTSRTLARRTQCSARRLIRNGSLLAV